MASPHQQYQQLLATVVQHLRVDAGLEASVEFPDCIVIPHSTPSKGSWWFGTVNEMWGGDLMTVTGRNLASVATNVPSDSMDAGAIAIAIQAALMPDAPEVPAPLDHLDIVSRALCVIENDDHADENAELIAELRLVVAELEAK